ncbi:MAG TPA: DUF1707 domain-containing protein [Solirubrobacteraceae bacterium]|nr:DUF1707 domain-containing protein [Solirubrobacteraceae bacterium]
MRGDERAAAIAPGEREAGLRVGDREREQVVDLLSQHAAEGRLVPEELEARIDEAHAACTRGELAVLTTDLPAIASRAARGSRPGLPGPLVTFVAVNLVLVAVWALSGAGYFWPIWPLLGWGLSLIRPRVKRRCDEHDRLRLA